MADAPDFTPISVKGNRVPGEAAVSQASTVAPNWNSGGWADNGPGTGGWDPKANVPPSAALNNNRGGATSFDINKYDVSQYQYPSDLMGANGEYGSNYVVFYINVAIDSKLLSDGSIETVEDLPPRDYDSLTGIATRSPNAAAATTTIGAGLAGAAGGKTIASTLGLSGKAGTALSAAAAVGGAAAVANQASTFTAQKKRLKTAVALHIPNQLSTRYSMNWEEEGVAGFAMGLVAAEGTEALIKAAQAKNFSNLAPGSSIAAAVAAATLAIPGTQGISKLTGLAANPRKEQIFKNVDFRTFQFAYEFFPRDETEAQNVLNIIKQFKLHMHPEFKDANSFLYVYPSEFDIFYYHGTEENMNLNRHTSCVLTELNVNYSPQGQFTTFANGMPTQINIQMTFKELSLLTKEKIQDGL